MLGRARHQGRLRRHARGRRGPARHLQRRRGRPRGRPTTAGCAIALRRHDADVDLPRGLRRRPARGHRRRSTSTACRCGSSTCPARRHLTAFALEVGAFALRCFERLLRHPLPGRQGRPRRASPTSPPAPWRTSAASPSARAVLLVDPATATQQERAARRRRRRPRAGPHVVRRPRHHEVVERHLAQRGLRHVHGDRRRATPSGPTGSAGSSSASSAPRPSRSTRWPAPGRSSTRCARRPTPTACSTSSPTRRARRCCACSSSTSATSGSATASATTWPSTAYGNTETTDLWDAIEEATGEPVRRIMDTWIFQGGYPLVTVRPTDDGQRLVLTQRRFLFDGDDDGSRWAVPVHRAPAARRRHQGGPRAARRRRGDAWRLLDPTAVVVVNAGGHGFYRVALRGRAARPAHRPGAGRAVDARALQPGRRRLGRGRGRRASRPTPSCAWPRLRRRARPAGLAGPPQRARAGATGSSTATTVSASGRFVRALVGPALAELGWSARDGEDDLTAELRGTLIRALAILGNDAEARAGPASSTSGPWPTPASVDPRWPPRRSRWWPPPAPTPTTTASSRPTATPPPPRSSSATSTPSPSSPTPAQMERTTELAFGPDVKTQNAPFLLDPCHRQPRPRRGGVAGRAGALGRGQRPLPQQLDRPHGRRGEDADQARGAGRRRRLLQPSTPSPRRPRRSSRSSSARGSTWPFASGPRVARRPLRLSSWSHDTSGSWA